MPQREFVRSAIKPIIGSVKAPIRATTGIIHNSADKDERIVLDLVEFAVAVCVQLGEEIFKASLEHPEGLWVGELDAANNLKGLATEDGR